MGRKKQLDTSMYFCPYEDCTNYGKVGADNQIIGAGRYGKNETQMLKCKVCRQRFRPVQLELGLTSCESVWYHVRQNVPEEGNG